MIPACILSNPKKGAAYNWNERHRDVKRRIASWKAGNLIDLWNEATCRPNRRERKNPKAPTQDSINVRRALQAAENGQYGKAQKLLAPLALQPQTQKPC
jgi:hypothetical protein